MKITEKEKEVLRYLCLTNQEISSKLDISTKTVETYIRNIFNKLACTNRREALVKALKENIININEVCKSEI